MSNAHPSPTVYGGASQVIITPPIGVRLGGTSEPDRYAEYTLDELTASALVLESQGRKQAFVSCDLIALENTSVNRIRHRIAENCDIDADRVLVTTTHTHCGPLTIPFRGMPVDDMVLQELERKIAGVVLAANRTLVPVKIGAGSDQEPDMTFNRRAITNDGRVLFPTIDGPALIDNVKEIEGPIDPEVGVVAVTSMDDRVMAVVWNYSLHCDIPTGKRYSADYPGAVAAILRRVLGEQTVSIFAPGACGDLEHLNPLDPDDLKIAKRYWDPEGEMQMRRWGQALAGSVLRCLAKMEAVDASADVFTDHVTVRRRGADGKSLEEARKTLSLGERADYRDTLFAQDVLRLAKREGEADQLALMVQVIGDSAWVGVPGELFCELGLKIKAGSPFEKTFIAELANGWHGYLPTRRAFDNGGYEATPYAHTTSYLEPEAGDKTVQACIELLRRAHAAHC